MSNLTTPSTEGVRTPEEKERLKEREKTNKVFGAAVPGNNPGAFQRGGRQGSTNGSALTDTPLTTAPNSPIM